MLRRLRWLMASSFLMAGVGCQTLGFTSDPVNRGSDETVDGEQLQLPARDGAKACVRAAAEQEKSNYHKEASALYERARSLDPNYEHVCRRLAVLYDKQENYPKADEEYAKAFKMFPRDADLHNDCGYSYYNRGQWAKAEEHFRKALEIQPENKRAQTNLGLTLAQQERYDESFDVFTKHIPPAQAHCNIAFILVAQGKKDEALHSYRQAAKLAPELKLAHAAIAKLEGREVPTPPVSPTVETPTAKPKTLPDDLKLPTTDFPDIRKDPVLPSDAIIRPDTPSPASHREPVRPVAPPVEMPEPRVPTQPTLEDIPVPPPIPEMKRFKEPPLEK